MVGWREAGFVPDSEEEDVDNDLSTSVRNSQTSPRNEGLLTASKSELEKPTPQCTTRTKSDNTLSYLQSFEDRIRDYNNESTHSTHVSRYPAHSNVDYRSLQAAHHRPQTVIVDADEVDELQADFEIRRSYTSGPASKALNNVAKPESNSIPVHEDDEHPVSTLSSPLSSVPSSPMSLQSISESLLRSQPRNNGAGSGPTLPDELEQVQAVSESRLAAQPALVDSADYQRDRRFRQRKPIQLHPFLLEGERYRQTMQAGGMKPIHLAPKPTVSKVAINRDTQYEDSESDDGRTAASPPRVPRRKQISSSPEPGFLGPPSDEVNRIFHSDDELPDVSVLLERTLNNGVQHGNKRRRTTYGKGERGRKGLAHAQTRSPRVDMFHIPPSPSTSTSITPRLGLTGRKTFRLPRPLSPNGIPTPAPSSELQPRDHTVLSSDSDSDIRPRGTLREKLRRGVAISATRQSDTENDSSENLDDSREIQRMRKRIKGVLPASWLRLDQQAQAQRETPPAPPKDQHTVSRGRDTELGRSPADLPRTYRAIGRSLKDTKPLNHDRSTGGVTHATNEQPFAIISDDSSEDRSVKDGMGFMENLDADIPEHDSIDLMRQPGTRSSGKNSTRKKKRQVKLVDVGVSRKRKQARIPSGFETLPSTSATTRTAQPETRKRSTATRKHAPQSPHLSLLEASAALQDTGTPVPQFIRLAMRQARSRKDKGRHSPMRKHIRLQTRTDTEEAQQVLHDWHSGALSRAIYSKRAANISNGRQPLAGGTSNHLQQRATKSMKIAPMLSERVDQKEGSGIGMEEQPQTTLPDTIDTELRSQQNDNHSGYMDSIHEPPIKNSRRETRKEPLFRSGQLEDLESSFDRQHLASAFRKQLRKADSGFHTQSISGGSWANLQMQRFLTTNESSSAVDGIQTNMPGRDGNTPTRQPRKRCPRRLDINRKHFRQPEDITPLPIDRLDADEQSVQEVGLVGLGGYGSRYSVDFDAMPFEFGTFFHESTFLGSGMLRRAIKEQKQRDFDTHITFTTMHYGGKLYKWGPWNELVASEVSSIFDSISKAFTRQADTQESCSLDQFSNGTDYGVAFPLTKVSHYLAVSLSFTDSIDRMTFLATIMSAIQRVSESLNAQQKWSTNEKDRMQVSFVLPVLCVQLLHIANNSPLGSNLILEIHSLLRHCCQALMNDLLSKGMSVLRDYHEDNRLLQIRETGIHADSYFLEAVVVLMRLTKEASIPDCGFWHVLHSQYSSVKNTSQVPSMEKAWHDIFTLLPFAEFDEDGLLRSDLRFESSVENWELVVILVKRVLELYPKTDTMQVSTLNSYLRSILARCHNLIQNWSWRKCEPILNVAFDFFARNGLSFLPNEDHRGSPRFLENLDEKSTLEILPADRAFHIFLKMLADGLRGMRDIYTDRKIQGIAWRFIPNHGRTYRRDLAVRQEEMDALRNNHDLLTVLYWASPSGFRPRIDLLRTLVDHTCSHREACRLNVRAWSLLVRFQLSTEEPLSALAPFSAWCKEMLQQTIVQHRLARTEAERQYEEASEKGNNFISRDILESTIESNQLQVLTALRDLVSGVKAALKVSKGPEATSTLIRDSQLVEIFKIFDPKKPRADIVVLETIAVLEAYILSIKEAQKKSASQSNEESQDYGDFPDMEDVEDIEMLDELAEPDIKNDPIRFLQEPLWHLLSNCFGAETTVSDKLLGNAANVWVEFAHCAVRTQGMRWGTFLDAYSSVSWQQLRDTRQTRIFTPNFFASILQRDSTVFEEHRLDFRTAWLISLVERESMLKYQNEFTMVLLNATIDDPLCANPPFSKRTGTDTYQITAIQLRERRLALISSILSNMRDSYESTRRHAPMQAESVRREYVALMKQTMASMRKNYEELQQGATFKGAYVEFVQNVVEFIQQYVAADICPVDSFFTNSAAFPLPAMDPTYVVGALRAYDAKLWDPKALKKLAIFFQTLSQRAAVDQQQVYLVSQLCTAISDTYEGGDPNKTTLRSALLQAIFPPYIEAALRSGTGWIVARPILRAIGRSFRDVLYSFSVTNGTSLSSAVRMLDDTLVLLCQSMELIVDHSGLLEQPHALSILTDMVNVVTTALPTIDYLLRRTQDYASLSTACVSFLQDFSLFATGHMTGNLDVPAPNSSHLSHLVSTSTVAATPATTKQRAIFQEIRAFSSRELNRVLAQNWHRSTATDQYFVDVSSNVRKEVVVGLGDLQTEREGLLLAIREFVDRLEALPALGTGLRGAAAPRGREGEGEEEGDSGWLDLERTARGSLWKGRARTRRRDDLTFGLESLVL